MPDPERTYFSLDLAFYALVLGLAFFLALDDGGFTWPTAIVFIAIILATARRG